MTIFDYFDDEGRRLYLIDTPGFDDTDRPDAETLGLLGTWLSASYAGGVPIDGVIFLQRITDVRMGGSGVRNIAMLKAMCDLQSYSRFAVVTTMWPSSRASCHAPRDRGLLAAREEKLRTDNRYFSNLISKGAAMIR